MGPRSGIQDFRDTVSQLRPRYDAMIAPSWVRDNAESELRTSLTSVDSATTGDPMGRFMGSLLLMRHSEQSI